MTKNKEMLSKVFEHFCNNEVENARKLFHKVIVEMSRDIHSELMAEEEAAHEHALETDMEKDLSDDIDAIHGSHDEDGFEHPSDEGSEHDAEEDLSDEMLSDEDFSDEDSSEEDHTGHEHDEDGECLDVESELKSHEAEDEQVYDRLEDLEDNFDELKKMFDELSDEEGEADVKESFDLERVSSVKKSGEVGEGPATGMTSGEKAKSTFSNTDNKVELSGKAVEIGKGQTHTGYDRQEPTIKAKELGKFVNRVKSSKDVLKAVGKQPAKGEIGSGKSGLPVDGNVDSVLGAKK